MQTEISFRKLHVSLSPLLYSAELRGHIHSYNQINLSTLSCQFSNINSAE